MLTVSKDCSGARSFACNGMLKSLNLSFIFGTGRIHIKKTVVRKLGFTNQFLLLPCENANNLHKNLHTNSNKEFC